MRKSVSILLLATAYFGCSPSGHGEAKADAPRKVAASPGKQVFNQWCAACHAPGPRYPGTASLAAKYGKDMPAALEERKDLTPDVVRYFVRSGVSIMPPFRKTEITDADLDSLGAYLSPKPEGK